LNQKLLVDFSRLIGLIKKTGSAITLINSLSPNFSHTLSPVTDPLVVKEIAMPVDWIDDHVEAILWMVILLI
jgi:hypothetical protein